MLVWTRSLDDWKEDQGLFLKYDLEFIHLPCVKTSPIIFSLNNIPAVYSVALTSQKGAEFLLDSTLGKSLLSKAENIYALGEGSANPLLSRGINVTIAKSKNGDDFCQWLIKSTKPETHFVLPGGTERAFDLEKAISAANRTAQTIHIYETKSLATTSAGSPIHPNTISKVSKGAVVCFASPSAVVGFQNAFPNRHEVVAVCIGQTTARATHSFKNVQVLDNPSIGNLFLEAAKIAK